MSNISFFSSSSYIYLPSKNNPKVALCVDNSNLIKNSFKLYNPFSLKAKILKSIYYYSFTSLNYFFKLFSSKKEKSKFIKYLENLLHQPLITSIYFATIKDKIVIQLQSSDAKILGYLKYPLNKVGLQHIKNEIKAFELLSKAKIVEPYILKGIYNKKPFLLIEELDGTIDIIKKEFIDNILKIFEKDNSYKLSQHPRIKELKKQLIQNNMKEYITIVEEICNNSTIEYKLVYEHGDFAPWNIIKVKDSYIPFDFEYFIEDGLEYFDIIKYYYQIGKLLKFKKDKELYDFVNNNINILEFKELFKLFLIKEIMINIEENRPFGFEENIIKILEKI